MFRIAGASNIAGRDPLPSDISGVVANFTALSPNGQGFLTTWACDSVDEAVPNTSMLNFNLGAEATPNSSVQMLSDSGSLCVYSSEYTGLLIDVSAVIVDQGPPSIMESVVGRQALPNYEVRVFTCTPDSSESFSPIWHDPAVHASPEAAADYLNSSGAFDFTSELFDGKVNFTATAGIGFGSCSNTDGYFDAIRGESSDDVVFVVQHVERDAEKWTAGWATLGGNSLTMNVSVDATNWDGVFAHEFGHAAFAWGHPSYSKEVNDYSNTLDVMSGSETPRFYAHRLLETGITDMSNFEVFDGQETTFDLHVNPSGSSYDVSPDQLIGVVAPVSAGVSHPKFPNGGNLAVVIEGLDRGSEVLELRDSCNDSSGAWDCTGVIFSVIQHSGGHNDIGPITGVAASGTFWDLAAGIGRAFERTFVVRVGETRNANGMSITVNSFDRDTGVFSVTLDGLVSEDFGSEGVFFPL